MTDTATNTETIAHLDFEPELPCEVTHERSTCTHHVLWLSKTPCGCVKLACQGAYESLSDPGNFHPTTHLRCTDCNTRAPFDEWFAIGVWAPVNR